MLLALLLIGIYRGLGSNERDAGVAAAIERGQRPAAPALPKRTLDDLPGAKGGWKSSRLTVVNFWASWCGPCRDEAPVLNEVSDEYGDRGVRVVGVNAGSEDLTQDAIEFAGAFDVTYALVRGDNSDKRAWGVRGYPETFLVNAQGRIVDRINGPVEQSTLDQLIDRELQRSA